MTKSVLLFTSSLPSSPQSTWLMQFSASWTVIWRRLQRILNHVARLVFIRNSRCDLIKLLFLEMHWLLVKDRSECKIATFAFRHLHNTLPLQLSDHLRFSPPMNIPALSDPMTKGSFSVPRKSIKSFWPVSLQVPSPDCFDSIPAHIQISDTTACKKEKKEKSRTDP